MSHGDEPPVHLTPHPADDDEGRDPAKVYLELAKMTQESFLNRRSYEWKVAFGLWTAIGLITYFAVQHAALIGTPMLWGFGVFYLLVLVVWCFGWQIPLRRAFEIDKKFKHYYMHKAEDCVQKVEGRNAVWPGESPVKYRDILKGWKDWGWNYGQTTITAVFLLGSFLVLCTVSGKPHDEQSKIEVKASGGAVKVQSEATK